MRLVIEDGAGVMRSATVRTSASGIVLVIAIYCPIMPERPPRARAFVLERQNFAAAAASGGGRAAARRIAVCVAMLRTRRTRHPVEPAAPRRRDSPRG